MELDIVHYQFIINSLYFWCAFLLCDLSLKHLYKRITIYLITVIYYIALSIFYYVYVPLQEIPYMDIMFALSLLVLLPLFYKSKISKIVFVLLSSILFGYLCRITSLIVINVLLTYFPEIDFISYEKYFTIGFHLLYLLCILSFIHICFKKAMNYISNFACYIIWLYPIVCFILVFIHSDLIQITKIETSGLLVFTSLIIMIYMSYIMIYVSIPKQSAMLSVIEEREKLEAIQKAPVIQKEIQKVYIKDDNVLLSQEKKYYEQVINSYHDLESRTKKLDSHLHALNQLLINENLAAAKVFLDKISQDFHDVDMMVVCNRPVINSLLSYYRYICLKHQIAFDMNVHFPQYMDIKEVDLCILIGNAMNNAIEASMYINKDRFINLDCRVRNKELFIVCDNRFDGFLNRTKDSFKSRKDNEGQGLTIISSLCEKYNGHMDIEYDQQIFSIYITISLIQHKLNTQ